MRTTNKESDESNGQQSPNDLSSSGKQTQPRRRWLRRALWGLAIGVAAVLVVPPLQVLYVAGVNPATTGPVIVRKIKSQVFGLKLTPAELLWRDLDDIPPFFVKCVWQMEDAKFFSHNGFDWAAIQRARDIAGKTGKLPVGASTITQQCARSLFLWQNRSWIRKGLEAYYTIWMELLLSKRRIMELYVNVIELGDGIYGLEAAAHYYCGKDAIELNQRECAILSVILPRPLRWEPWNADKEILGRRSMALRRAGQVNLPTDFPQ